MKSPRMRLLCSFLLLCTLVGCGPTPTPLPKAQPTAQPATQPAAQPTLPPPTAKQPTAPLSTATTRPQPTAVPPTATPPAPVLAIDDSILAGVGEKGASAANDDSTMIVLFEERHDSRSVQLEIAVMLNRLYHRNGLRHLALEGAVEEEEPPSAGWFYRLPDAAVRRDVALQLLAQGEISAAEFTAMVFPDFQLHSIEKEKEYGVEISDNASMAPLYYLYLIAANMLTPDQIQQANDLIDQGKEDEAVDYILNANSWTAERYALLNREEPILSIEEMNALIGELEAKVVEVGADVGEYQADFEGAKAFYGAAANRTKTMVQNTIKIVRDDQVSLIAYDFGAAHAKGVLRLLEEQSASYVLFSPLSFMAQKNGGDLTSAEYNRKLLRRSIDPQGFLGALLDDRRKPRPVLNEEWFQIKADVMYAGIVIARAAAGGGGAKKPPFDLDKEALGLVDPEGNPGLIDIDLAAIQTKEVTVGGKTTRQVIVPVQLLTRNKTIYMCVAQTAPDLRLPEGENEEQILEKALLSLLDKTRAEENLTAEQEEKKESENSSDNPAVGLFSMDVKAAVSDDLDVIEKVVLEG